MAKKALGRGLGALMGGGGAQASPAGTPRARGNPSPPVEGESGDVAGPGIPEGDLVRNVALDRVKPSPLQPRRDFGAEELGELMESIREHGIIQPLIVREVGDHLELIAGERRYRASRELGLGEVPVIVREASDRDVLEMALIENLQREDLNPIEEARAYVRLADDFKLRQEDIARRVGKSRAGVANSMRLLDLPDEVREMVSGGTLSAGHAKVLLGSADVGSMLEIAGKVVAGQLSVRATEKLVSQSRRPSISRAANGSKAIDEQMQTALKDVEKRLRNRFTSAIAIRHGEKKGRIEIEYYGTEDLNRILDLLGVGDTEFS